MTVHTTYMQKALTLAAQAAESDEVPVGAVVVLNGEVIGAGANQPIGACDPTAHAEIVAMREAAKKINNYRLTSASLYVTLEPCWMCYGAMLHARIGHLYYGASDPKVGVLHSGECGKHAGFNHHIMATGGLLEPECSALLKQFFKAKR